MDVQALASDSQPNTLAVLISLGNPREKEQSLPIASSLGVHGSVRLLLVIGADAMGCLNS